MIGGLREDAVLLGGWRLSRPAAEISILEIVEAAQGSDGLFECDGVPTPGGTVTIGDAILHPDSDSIDDTLWSHEERHTNHRGTIQGGLLSTFADFALGRAIENDADDDKDRATVSLTVDFLKPARPGDWIESRTRVDRVGGTLAFADCTLTAGDREIVRARAVWVVAG